MDHEPISLQQQCLNARKANCARSIMEWRKKGKEDRVSKITVVVHRHENNHPGTK